MAKQKPKTSVAKKPVSKLTKTKVSQGGVKSLSTNLAKKRVRTIIKHKSFKVTKKSIIKKKPLPGIKQLVKDPIKLIFSNKKKFFLLILVHAVLVFVFLKGFGSSFDFAGAKATLEENLGGEKTGLGGSVALFSYVLSSFNTQASEATGVYQFFITLIVLLATIWLTRRLFNGEKPKVKEAFYSGMYPIIPYILVIFTIGLQLLPMVIGNFILSTVLSNGLAVTFLEKFIFILIFFGLATLSFYMILSSVLALNIVTLPNVAPLQALRSARELVLHRRIGVFARLIVLPVILFLLAAVIFIPLIMFLPVLVDPLFLLASSFGLIFFTVYMYNFYRLLL